MLSVLHTGFFVSYLRLILDARLQAGVTEESKQGPPEGLLDSLPFVLPPMGLAILVALGVVVSIFDYCWTEERSCVNLGAVLGAGLCVCPNTIEITVGCYAQSGFSNAQAMALLVHSRQQ